MAAQRNWQEIMSILSERKQTTLACFRGYADCVEGAIEKGIIYGTGVYRAGEIKNTKCMQEAHEMGKNV